MELTESPNTALLDISETFDTSPQSPNQPSTPQSPNQPSTPQSPNQTSTPQSPNQTSTPQSPNQTSTPQTLSDVPANPSMIVLHSRAQMVKQLRSIPYSTSNHRIVTPANLEIDLRNAEFVRGKIVIIIQDIHAIPGFQCPVPAQIFDKEGVRAVEALMAGEDFNLTIREYVDFQETQQTIHCTQLHLKMFEPAPRFLNVIDIPTKGICQNSKH
jgi:hypothetical protein